MNTPLSPQQLFARLESLGIKTTTVTHPAVYTVEEAKQHRELLAGCHIKNLFLRDKKKRYFLIVAREDLVLNLKELGARLGTARLSFARPVRLMEKLGVEPGSVSPFGVVNDVDKDVRVIIDKAVLAHGPVNCHPLCNTMTTAIASADLVTFLEDTGHPPMLVDFQNDDDGDAPTRSSGG